VIEQVGALPHHGVAIALHGVDHDLGRFLRQLLCDLGAASTHQSRGTRQRGIALLEGKDGSVEPLQRISHADHLTLKPIQQSLTIAAGEKHFAKKTPDAVDGTGRQQHDLQVWFAGFIPPVF
jgi:hypothetical protein